MAGYSNLPAKKDVARALLLRGNVFVYLDPRAQAAKVPDWVQNQPQLVLQIGLDMANPIPDLRVDDRGVSGTLPFSREPYRCHVGWDAVFAIVGDDGRGMVWPGDFPPEIAAEVDREGSKQPRRPLRVEATPERVEQALRPKRRLRLVGGAAQAAPAREDSEERPLAWRRTAPLAKRGATAQTPYLRLVK